MIRGVIFDLGGVLVEWSNSITYKYLEEKYGIDPDTAKRELEKQLPLVQMGKLSEGEWFLDFFNSLGIEPPEDYDEIWGKTFKVAKNNDDVIRIVKELRARDYKIGVLSNIELSRAAEVRRRGIMDYLDAVIFSCQEGTRKNSHLKYDGPSEIDIFRLTIDAMGLEPEECVYIDDTLECVRAAEEAGMKGILFINSEQLKQDLMNYKIVID